MNYTSLIGHVIQLLEHIDSENYPADRLAADFFRQKKYLGARDRRFIAETVFGMIRHRKFIKTLISQFIRDNPSAAALEGPHLRYFAQYVSYSLAVEKRSLMSDTLMGDWKTHFPRIDLQQFAKWIQKNHSLDFIAGDEIQRLSTKFSFPDWMVKEWVEQIGNEIEPLLEALNKPAPTTIRVNLLKVTRDDCQHRLREEGIETDKTSISPCGLIAKKRFNMQSLKSFQDGFFEMQDEGSQLISIFAYPRPGYVVIDSCAGAGGKSLHMAELMQNTGEIFALDVNERRLQELRSRCNRAGINIIKPKLADKVDAETFTSKADLVIVDAPCSGIGTIRRNPNLKWRISESLVQHYAQKQRQILQNNARFVKPGGRLIYVTCSLFRLENENIAISFLNNNSIFRLSLFKGFGNNLRFEPDKPYLTLYPHLYNTDGFFVASFTREQG